MTAENYHTKLDKIEANQAKIMINRIRKEIVVVVGPAGSGKS